MMNATRIVSWVLASCTVLCVQGQLNTWLVREVSGDVHVVDFSTAPPTVGPAIAGFGSGGSEDVNLMTDATGNILFGYAVDGADLITVRDANLNPMPNGAGLLDNFSGLESSITPVPCHSDRWFIIHRVFDPAGGDLYYSEVDLSLNGGLGDVTAVKNVLLGSGASEGFAVTRQTITGCRWLFACHIAGTNYEIRRYLISDTDIGPPTVAAVVALTGTPATYPEIELNTGMNKLALSVPSYTAANPDIIQWDLDLNSGSLSNRTDHNVSAGAILGIEYSPLDQWLFFQGNDGGSATDFGRMNTSTLAVEIITTSMGAYRRSLEEAGNGHIYSGGEYYTDYMAEVSDPDNPVLSAIGFNMNGVMIASGGVRCGLPNAIEGEVPGSAVPTGYIAFSATALGGCDTYQFMDSTCLATWWEWDFGDGTTSNVQAPLHTYATGIYDVMLRVVACGDTLQLTKPAYITSSSLAPVAGFSFPDTLCQGATVTFINTSSGATDYAWDLGDGTTSTWFAPVHPYTAAGTFIVQLIASNSCLTDTIEAPITILPGGTAAFTVSGDTCALEVILTNTSSSGPYQWDLGDGSTSTLSSPQHVYAGLGVYVITLIAAAGLPCADTTSTTVSVTMGPTASFSATVGCGQQVDLQDQSIGASSLSWDLGDGTSASDTAFTHVYATDSTYSITLTAYGTSGCTDDSTLVVVVPSSPIADFTYPTDPCASPSSLTNTSENSSNFWWDLGDGSTSTDVDVVHLFAAPDNYLVTLIADPGTPCADTTSVEIVVGEIPQSLFTDTVQCQGLVELFDQSLNAASIEWILDDGTVSTEDTLAHVFDPPGPHAITLVATSGTGCVDSLSVIVDVPPAVIAVFSSSTDVCDPGIGFHNASQNADLLVWLFGDGATSTLTDPDHTYSMPGDHEVTLIATDAYGCSDTAVAIVGSLSGDVPPGLFVPNCFTPNGDGMNDRFIVDGMPQCFDPSLLIFNRWGELIYETHPVKAWDGRYNGSEVPDGVYVYVVSWRGGKMAGHVTLLR